MLLWQIVKAMYAVQARLLHCFHFQHVLLRTLNFELRIMAAVEGELRHRKVAAADRDEASVADTGGRSKPEKKPESSVKDGKQLQPGTYWLTRIVFTRSLGFIYCELSAGAWSG